MRVAVYAPDRDARYALSRLMEETLVKRGIIRGARTRAKVAQACVTNRLRDFDIV